MSCPDDNVLAELAQGLLSASKAEALDDHLDGCADCAAVVAELGRLRPPSEPLDESATVPAKARRSKALTAGDRVGRYAIRRRVGVGAMGTVYAAHDPELDRLVAVKLLHPSSAEQAADATGRIRREARAMAQVSDPHVVAVLDVGDHDGATFVAMEFVDGPNLRAWLDAQTRTPDDILARFVEAARGLAAAHEAGVVHRDIKPANILVGPHGSARVTDFGLAIVESAVITGAVKIDDGDPRVDDLTATGALLGTPRYMSPEQLRGEQADPRSDQFSLAVALYQALWGSFPFEGDRLAELSANVEAGRVRVPPKEPARANRAWPTIRKALRVDPSDRFDTMRGFVRGLEPTRGAKSSRVAAAAAVAVAVAATAAIAVSGPDGGDCADESERLIGAWQARRAEVETALLSADPAHGAQAWTSVSGRLDAFGPRWADVHRTACTLESAERDVAVTCLQRVEAEFSGFVDALAAAAAPVVARAARGSRALTDPGRCLQPDDWTRPADPERRDEGEAIRSELAAIRSLRHAGRYGRGRDRVQRLLGRVDALGDRGITAEAQYELGAFLMDAGQFPEAEVALNVAIAAAEESGHEQVAIKAMVSWVFVVGVRQERHDDVQIRARAAAAAITRRGGDDVWSAQLHDALGGVALGRGDYDQARAEFEAGLQLRQGLERTDDLAIARSYNNLGAVFGTKGDFEAAREHFAQASEIERQGLGAHHPELADTLNNLGTVLRGLGRYEEALAKLEEALTLRRDALGAEHPHTAGTISNIGNVYLMTRRYPEAVARFEQALAIYQRDPDVNHVHIATTLDALGATLAYMGREDEAVRRLERALQIRERRLGPDHPFVARTLNNLGRALIRAGRGDEAVARVRRALEIFEATSGPEHPELLIAWNNMGGALAATGDHEQAIEIFDRAVAVAERDAEGKRAQLRAALLGAADSEIALRRFAPARARLQRAQALSTTPGSQADASFALAKALRGLGKKPEARAAAERALTGYADNDDARAEVEAWLSGR